MNFGEAVTDSEREAVEKLKQAVAGWKYKNFDHFWNYFRFLEDHKFDIEKSTVHLKRCLRNRDYFHLDKVENLDDVDPEGHWHRLKERMATAVIDPEQIEKGGQLSFSPQHSNSVLFCAVWNEHASNESFLNHFRPQEFLRFYFIQIMHTIQINMEREKRTGERSETIAVVDIKGAVIDFHHVHLQLSMTTAIVNYATPHSCLNVIVLNANAFLRKLVNFAMKFFPYAGNIHFMTPEEMIQSKKFQFDPRFIPKMWGGELTDPNGDHDCHTILLRTKPESDHVYRFPSDQLKIEREKLQAEGKKIVVVRSQFYDVDFTVTHELLEKAKSIIAAAGDEKNHKISLRLHCLADAWYTLKIFHNLEKMESKPGKKSAEDEDERNLYFDFGPFPPFEVPDLVLFPIKSNLPGGRYTFRFGYQSIKIFSKLKLLYTLDLVVQDSIGEEIEIVRPSMENPVPCP